MSASIVNDVPSVSPAGDCGTGPAVAPPDRGAPVDPARLWEVCVHEASHAVCALLLGVEDIGCAVFEADGVSGVASKTPETEKPPDMTKYTAENMDALYAAQTLPDIMLDATWTAAGKAGVDLLLHPEKTETVPTGGDAALLTAAARRAFPGADFYVEMSFAHLAAARARQLLKPRMWRVAMVAKELQRKHRLTAEEVCKAMFPEQYLSAPKEALAMR